MIIAMFSIPAKIKTGLGLFMLATVVLLGGLVVIFSLRPADLEPPMRLRLALPMQPGSGLVMIAQAQGYFQANGLDVSISEYPSGKRALLDNFQKGLSDMALTTDVPAVIAALNDYPFKIIASISSADNANRILARRDAGITQPADLLGKHIATQKASAVHFFLHLFLVEHNIAEKQVKLSFFEPVQLPQALADGNIDAFSMREPFISQGLQLLGDKYTLFQQPGLYNQFELVVVTPQLMMAHPEAVRRFLQATAQAQKFVVDQPQQAITIISQRLNMSAEDLMQNWPTTVMRLELSQSLLLLLEDIARWALAEGIVSPRPLPDLFSHIETAPLGEIAPATVTLIH